MVDNKIFDRATKVLENLHERRIQKPLEISMTKNYLKNDAHVSRKKTIIDHLKLEKQYDLGISKSIKFIR